MMSVTTKITRIPLKVPMMLLMSPDGSISSCVVLKDTDGVSGDVVGTVKSVVTITPAKGHYQRRHSNYEK